MSVTRGLRAVALGAVLVVALSALTLHSNLRYGRYLTASSLPTGAVFAFVVVLIANAPFARQRSRLALARGELATIFSMLFLSAALPQASVGETLVTLAVAPAYLPKGTPHVDKFDNKVPNWLLVRTRGPLRSSTPAWALRADPSRGARGSCHCSAGPSSCCCCSRRFIACRAFSRTGGYARSGCRSR